MKLYLDISPQPDDSTCGPTCLHAIYRYFGDPVHLNQIISEVTDLEDGGTLAVYLACHALRRGYKATIYTYNLKLFDPTWFVPDGPDISDKLKLQLRYKRDDPLFNTATHGYLKYLELGGRLRFRELTPGLIRKYLKREVPVLTGLNATYLYKCSREYVEGLRLVYDDIRGESTGHFVVLAGYDKMSRNVLIADPLKPNPVSSGQQYEVNIYRLVCSIMLGVVTYDDNLLVIEPRRKRKTFT
ncbi:MAG: hypothetical protein WBY47_15975 [Desulfobacterales bacterium]|jgi:hypothetical protein